MARALGTRARFAVAYLLLGAAVGGGLGAFAVLLKRPGPKPPPPWSSWQPNSASRPSQVLEIADHIGQSYQQATGNQLAAVRVGSPRSSNVRAIGIPTKSPPKTLADFKLYDKNRSVIFILCGDGKRCSIGDGKPTPTRGTALRREALELALYTLKYEDPVDNVLVFFPPDSAKAKLSLTLFFHRSDLKTPLDHPLRRTLPQAQPPESGQLSAKEKRNVDDLTASNIFRYIEIAPAPGYGSVLVVQPVA